jgi:hypothetical protein
VSYSWVPRAVGLLPLLGHVLRYAGFTGAFLDSANLRRRSLLPACRAISGHRTALAK